MTPLLFAAARAASMLGWVVPEQPAGDATQNVSACAAAGARAKSRTAAGMA
jgi:hypothetical protein